MEYSVFDIEANGLYDEVTKIHCVAVRQYTNTGVRNFTLTDYEQIKQFFANEKTLVGHNIIRYDIPVLEKILNIKVDSFLIDTLGLSWYLYPLRNKHGLEEWGEYFGIEKPKIVDWNSLTVEDYSHRCQEDVKINDRLFSMQREYINKIYDNNFNMIQKVVEYISFKLKCAEQQERIKWKLDVEKCKQHLETLNNLSNEKIEILSNLMPPKIDYKIVNKPKKMYKADGTLSSLGEKWVTKLTEYNLPLTYNGYIEEEVSRKKGNPASHEQLKNWLYTLGWKPKTFKFVKNKKTEEVKKIEQVSNSDGSDICDSVKELYNTVPELVHLESFYKIKHRIGIFEGFLANHVNGYIEANVKGFTNTLRFQHTTLVNLPTVHKFYGKEIRECLTCEEDELLCGSDMSSLEDSTKQHYMYYYDPNYVDQMRKPGFDPHLDIAELAGLLTTEQVIAHKEKREDHSKVRKDAKQVNFACVYGAGPPKISQSSGMTLEMAKLLHTIYWKRNWSVKKVSNSCYTKTVNNQMWLYNPVSGMYYSLRYEKDKFSTLNQGTGVYCFDTWVKYAIKKGLRLCGQFHDELISVLKKSQKEEVELKLKEAIKETNEELKLNITLGISIDFGSNYAQIH